MRFPNSYSLSDFCYLEKALGEHECPIGVGSVISSSLTLFQSCIHRGCAESSYHRSPAQGALTAFPLQKSWQSKGLVWAPEDTNGVSCRGNCLCPPAAGKYAAPCYFREMIVFWDSKVCYSKCL